MKMVLINSLLLVCAGMIAGCASNGAAGGKARATGATGNRNQESDERLAQVQAAIEAQNREIAALRATLVDQDKRVQSDVDRINATLDSHLELLDLLYRQAGQSGAVAAAPEPGSEMRASVFGSAAIRQRRGEPLPLKRMQVSLLQDKAADDWSALSAPRTLYNTPIQNADTILTALEFKRDLELPSGSPLNESRSDRALNSHLRAFEKALPKLTVQAAAGTRENGKYFFSEVPPGDYQVYARISPETYSVCWLVSVRVLGGGAYEINLNEGNAKVFLNDLESEQ
jgi:hypothetical protein